jgi:hypothetical protein
MIEKKKQVLARIIDKIYKIKENGDIYNIKTGFKVSYVKNNGQIIVSLWDSQTKKNYQFTREQLLDWKNGKEKVYRCKICNKWAKDIWCDYCKEKLEAVRIVIKNAKK